MQNTAAKRLRFSVHKDDTAEEKPNPALRVCPTADVLTSSRDTEDVNMDRLYPNPLSLEQQSYNRKDGTNMQTTTVMPLQEENRVQHEIPMEATGEYSVLEFGRRYPVGSGSALHAQSAPEQSEVDTRDSPPTKSPMHLFNAPPLVDDSFLMNHQSVASGNSKKSIWKPKGLTLSAFRRPENTVRLTRADPSRRLEMEYELHGPGAGRSGVLGHGAFATVRLAVRKSDGMQVAVKSIAKHEALRSRRLRRVDGVGSHKYYMEEWEILRRLQDHPYVITLLDVFENTEEIQLVTEYCPGGELFDAIQKKQRHTYPIHSDRSCSEVQAAQITSQILKALAAVHAEGIVHRDVKPENILLAKPLDDSTVHVKLCDFGVARPLIKEESGVVSDPTMSSVCVSSDGEASPLTPGSRSRSFSTIGSDYYAAPELTYGGSYDTAVDIYSLGVTLYILLCGFPPVFSSSAMTVTQEEDSDDEALGEVLFPDAYWGEVSEGAKALLRRMLHPDAATRVTAKEALSDPWILHLKGSKRPVHVVDSKTSVDLDMVRNQLVKSLGHQKQLAVSKSPSLAVPNHLPTSAPPQRESMSSPTRKRARDTSISTPRRHRRLQSRNSTAALMALADLYCGVAAPTMIAAATVAAAASSDSELDDAASVAGKDGSEGSFVPTGSPVAALSF